MGFLCVVVVVVIMNHIGRAGNVCRVTICILETIGFVCSYLSAKWSRWYGPPYSFAWQLQISGSH
jgi:hypothetical protein